VNWRYHEVGVEVFDVILVSILVFDLTTKSLPNRLMQVIEKVLQEALGKEYPLIYDH
jgi:hypothetical protein